MRHTKRLPKRRTNTDLAKEAIRRKRRDRQRFREGMAA